MPLRCPRNRHRAGEAAAMLAMRRGEDDGAGFWEGGVMGK